LPLTIDSTRFGAIEIADESVIEFPSGLIGLGGSRYALVARDEESAFVWLHSVDDPSLALPVTNPWRFFESYTVELSDVEAERIGIDDPAQADVYVTVRAAEALEDFSANLRAPIVISGGRGWQVINEAEDAPVRAPLFAEVTETAAA
jgi:flagellar assembly factor FliW